MQNNEDSQSRRKQIAENLRSSFNNSRNVRIIPSRQDLGQDTIDSPERIGAYCRVSTKADAQVESYEMQKKYYEDYILKHPSWTLVDIYADEGISATSMKNRKDFLRLVQDCKSGRITKVITKSISRFARNVVDCVETARMLKNLTPPVGIVFETDNLDTLRNDIGSQLSIRASFAEYESVTKSNAIRWGIKSRFANGIPALRDLYGYSRNKRILTIDPNESHVIRMMYQQVANGHSIAEVQRILRSTRVPSPNGNTDCSSSTILYILTNEKYCGDVHMQKTITIDMFSHKSIKNDGYERGYYIENYHPAIIQRDLWNRVQRILGKCEFNAYFSESENEFQCLPGRKFKAMLA